MEQMIFGYYIVRKESKNFYAIYNEYANMANFITHRTSWRSACKVAKLLDQAYREGREDGKDLGW